ncbi:MAG: hypothetical protein QW165_00465 [Candidatus Woesearchaeota archaeon]
MRFYFFILFSIFLVSTLAVITADTITGNIPKTPNCGAERTYAFYRTLEEKQRAEAMWEQAGFVPVGYEVAPDSFHPSGRIGFMCLRRKTLQELGQEHMWQRDRVVTEGSSI